MRRHLPRSGPRWLPPRRRETAWFVAWVLLTALLASLIALPARTGFHYRAGQVVQEPVVSRVEFASVDKNATEERKLAAKNREPAIYLPNESYFDSLRQRFAGLIALADHESIEQIPSDTRQQVNISEAGFRELQKYKRGEDGRSMEQWNRLTEQFLRDLFDLAILDHRSSEQTLSNLQAGAGRIVILHPNPATPQQAEQIRYENVIYRVRDTQSLRENLEQEAMPFPAALRPTIVSMVMQNPQPTYLFNEEARELTRQRRQQRYEEEPPVLVTRQANEVLVPAGTRLSEAQVDLLQAEQQTYESQLSPLRRWLTHLGLAGLMLLISLGLWIYIARYSPRIIQNPMRGLAIALLVLLSQALAVFLTQLHPELIYATAVFPTLMTAVVLTIAYDQRFALAVGAIHTLLVLVSLDLPVSFGLVLLTGVGVSAALLREVRTRSTLVVVGLWAGLAMAVVTLLTSLAQPPAQLWDDWRLLVTYMVHVFITGVGTGLLVQGILPAIERVFKVTTAMTLRELNDASHPLLQRLAQEAPGTYQHSLRIADIAEAAAESIGADALLCRVGAMYHDIGKINKPLYFVENQGGGPNRHAKLSPAMSLLIIVGHVKDGIEMAREYRLPSPIRHFIESHHGTTLVEYFYHAARQQKEAAAPSEFEFRYPGPKPQTKEAAILMLADGVEGAARALPEPTPVRLEQLIHRMANKRLMDGQFDECNLTLQELHKIEQAMTKVLCAIYHARVKYPEREIPPAPSPTAEPVPPAAPTEPSRPRSAAI
ncbi:MAG TPA: HDIG domain-containing protein [Phycisphaeraceae bacterium]